MPSFTPMVTEFLAKFFGESSHTKLEHVYNPNAGQNRIKKLIDRLAGEPNHTVLPYIDHEKNVTWFGLAFDDAQYTSLSDSLYAFLGPSYSTFKRGNDITLSHPMLPHVKEVTDGRYFIFEADNKYVMKQIGKMIDAWESRPLIKRTNATFNLYHLLRDYFISLEANEEIQANMLYELIRSSGQMNAQNILYLRVQFLAKFEKWGEIFDTPGISEVISSRRPLAVTEALLAGIYAKHIQPYEERLDIEGVIKNFLEEVWPLYSRLFQSRRDFQTEPSLKAYAIQAVAIPSKSIQIEKLEHLTREAFYSQLLKRVQPMKQVSVDEDPYKIAQREIEVGNAEGAFLILFELSPSVRRTVGLLDCAVILLDLASIKEALEAYEALEEDERKQIKDIQRMRSTLQLLQSFGQNERKNISGIPSNWLEWFDLLPLIDEGLAVEFANQGSNQWSIVNLSKQDPGLGSLYASFNKTEQDAELNSKLERVVPFLISFFRNDEQFPRPEWKRVYIWLIQYLVNSSNGGYSDISLFNQMMLTVGAEGVDRDSYRLILKSVITWVEKYASSQNQNILIDTCEVLNMIPCSDLAIRLQLIHTAEQKLKDYNPAGWETIKDKIRPSGWADWFVAMSESSSTSEFLLDLIPKDDLMDWNYTLVSEMTETLIELPSNHVTKLLLPKLIDAVTKAPTFPRQEMSLFYESLLMLMLEYSSRNYEDTLRFLYLIDGMLQISPQKVNDRWSETEQWFSGNAFNAISDLFLDIIDLFFDFPLPKEKMQELWSRWCDELMSDIVNNTRQQILKWYQIGKRVSGLFTQMTELKDALDKTEAISDPLSALKNKVITIFTFREKAAARVASQLQERNSSLQVRICTDDCLTDRAKEYARNSDISVVVTTCISHALTLGIKEYLQHDPVYPRSSGESSIIDAIEQYAQKQ